MQTCDETLKPTEYQFLPDGTVTIDGFIVPHLEVTKLPDSANGTSLYTVVVDKRLGFFIEGEENLRQAISIAADAMAVACGNSSFGKHCRPMGKFNKLAELNVSGLNGSFGLKATFA